jgi:hypothetical protein
MEQTKLSVQEIASRLVELAGSGQFETAQNELFAPDAISIELPDTDGNISEANGLDAIGKKREQFQAAVESVQGLKVSSPIIQGNAFAFEFELDFTLKTGGPQRLAEICLYQVKDGKVVREQFFA